MLRCRYLTPENVTGFKRTYVKFALVMRKIAQSNAFNAFVMLCIIVAGVMIGVQSYDDPEINAVADVSPQLCAIDSS